MHRAGIHSPIDRPPLQAGIFVRELTPVKADLEQAFLRLTDDSGEEKTVRIENKKELEHAV